MKKNNLIGTIALISVCIVFLLFTFIFFSKTMKFDWIYVGDTLNSLIGYSFQYSGIARGEYPIWNPLVRAGENEIILQVFDFANPISNLVIVSSLLLNIKDIILSYSVFIYIMIVLYVAGLFLLVSCWTKNRYAGIFAAILALSSSSVIFYTHSVSFVHILYAIPWILYSLTMYFRNCRFKYLLIFMLAFCVFLYSYEFVLGAAYFLILATSYLIFNYCGCESKGRLSLAKIRIPHSHLLLLFGILLILCFPLILAFFQYKYDFLPISRIAGITVTDNYAVGYKNIFTKISFFPLVSIKFYISLFTGFIFHNLDELRQYVGPIAMLFSIIALFSRRRVTNSLALTAFLICLLAGDIPPVNLLLKLPVFSAIRNLHFFLQYLLLTLIILAGFGFDYLIRMRSLLSKIIFNVTAIMFLLICMFLFFIKNDYFQYNQQIIVISFVAISLLLFIVNFLILSRQIIMILVVCGGFTITAFFLSSQIPVLSGGINNNLELLNLRARTNHSLKFIMERPDQIQGLDLSGYWEKWVADFGQDEYSSMLTLKDNSYKSMGKSFGFSSFPFLKKYHLFLSLPGHEILIAKKFFFFNKFFISKEPKDMLAFRKDENLFKDMLERSVGIINKPEEDYPNMSLGLFNPDMLKDMPLESKERHFSVAVKEYKANSLIVNVSTDQAGLFTYADIYDRDWYVRVDGKNSPLKEVFRAFKGVIIQKGNHEVEFIYQNKALYPILFMNILFSFITLAMILYYLKNFIGSKSSSIKGEK
ncbi:MAG: YfhO family protein [Candidatus Omnitrophica bacterium]|nr:YfhO family protein [Candidatus Omnitrophota bacterium]